MKLTSLKKFALTAVAGLALAAPLTAPAAAADVKIGVVDVQKILLASELNKQLMDAQKEVQEAEQRLAKAYEEKRKDLEEKRKTLSDDDFIALQRKYEDQMNELKKSEEGKLVSKRESMMKIKEQLEKSLSSAVTKIANDKGLTLVLSKQVVVYGGQDITQDVQNAMK